MGNKAFTKFQIGKETTRGTAVAADTLLLGQVTGVRPDRKPVYPSENIGVRADALRSVVHQYLVQDTFASDHAYFQLLPLVFGCGLKGGVTAAEANAGQADYEWNQSPSMIAANTPDAFTGEKGDDVQAFEFEYAMIERIRLAWSVSQGMEASPVSLEFDFFARQLTSTTFTGAINPPVVEPLNGKLSRMFLDTSWSGVGGTEKTGILRGADIEILTGLHPVFAGSAGKYFDSYAEGVIAVTAQLVLEGNSDADAIWDAHQAQTFQVLRLQLNGGQIGSGDNHVLNVDIGGTWESVQPINSEDKGSNLHAAVFHGFYDVTGAKLLQVNTTTNVASY